MLGVMEERVGTLASTFVTYAGGGLAVTILMLVFQAAGCRSCGNCRGGCRRGIMGLVVVASLGVSVANLGLAAGLTLFTAATLVLGALYRAFRLVRGRALSGPDPLARGCPRHRGDLARGPEADRAQPTAMAAIATMVSPSPRYCRFRRCSAFTHRAKSTVTAG